MSSCPMGPVRAGAFAGPFLFFRHTLLEKVERIEECPT